MLFKGNGSFGSHRLESITLAVPGLTKVRASPRHFIAWGKRQYETPHCGFETHVLVYWGPEYVPRDQVSVLKCFAFLSGP